MSRKRSFGHLLITYTMILLLPVIVIGLLIIFAYMDKLEENFEQLNTKTMEAATVRLDLLMEDVLAVDYQLSLDVDVHDFVTREFADKGERLLLLQDVRDTITDSMIGKKGVISVALYSQVNDMFVGNSAAFDWRGLLERYFARSDRSPEEVSAALTEVGVMPVWLDSGEYLIYCSNIMTSGYSAEGRLLVIVSKQTLLNTWSEVFGNLEAECAILYRGQEVLLQTEGFERESSNADSGYISEDSLVKKYVSQKMGSLTYVYTVDHEQFGGDIAPMFRKLVLAILMMLTASVCLAGRKAKHIRAMYTEVLEEKMSLEEQLNAQVEELNRQLLRNALLGFDHLTPEKQGAYLKNSRLRVLIFRLAGEETFKERRELRALVRNCLATENMGLLFLHEKDVGYICVLGYETQEDLEQTVVRLRDTLAKSCGTGVYMGLSKEIRQINKLAQAYERAGMALHHCSVMKEDGGLVAYSDISELEKERHYYPPDKEKQLLRSIRMGLREDVEENLKRIYQVNFRERRLSRGATRQLLVRMLNTVYELMDTVYNGEPEILEDIGQVSRNVLSIRSSVNAFGTLRDLMLSICDKCAERKEGELRKRIIAYIGENFRDQELSLEKMADDFEMSYYHLSRLFNECMQMNFTAYLVGLRLEYSTELLCTKNYSVEQVAQQAGFLQSGSYIRAFKKYYGVTPGKYREEQQKK